MVHLERVGWVAAIVGLVVVALPRPAAACGGTFCDGAGPQQMPVDQTGENVLFVLAEDHVEAHVQIRYAGEADQFAWIVPVQAVPEIAVGSDPLFTALLTATVPTVVLGSRTEGRCANRPAFGCGAEAARDGGSLEDDQGGSPTDPDVVASGVAGAFEYAVLEGGTVDGVVQWLDGNGYAQDDEAQPLLQEYLDRGFLFVAFRLRGGVGIDAIHPVVLRYPGAEPCVPIRLTRIAAQPDMGVRVFFLGDRRFVPTNYRHVLVNPLKLDWIGLGANYEEVVTLAVDEEGAEGHAFVTEYAGESDIVDPTSLASPSWFSPRFAELAATQVDDELERQGLFACGDGRCYPQHPLVPALMHEWFPTPAGLGDEEFWGDFDAALDPTVVEAFDPVAFAADVEERIVGPGEHAQALLQQPYLTRMYTTISPEEMTIDPLFHAVDGLPDVSNQLVATQVLDCQGNALRIELPDGREIWLDEDGQLPELAAMPWAEVVETVPPAGAPMVVADHRDDIDAELDAWNEGRDGCGCTIAAPRLDALLLTLLVGLGLRSRRCASSRHPRRFP